MKNWKTTFVAFLAAFWIIAQPIITKGDFDFVRDWKSLVTALVVSAFGLVVKDYNVTGGNSEQNLK